MMGFYLHRKLLNDTEDQQQAGSTVPKPCAVFCDAQKNPIGLCPPSCIKLCDSVCKDPPPLILPDAQPPITVTPAISHSKHFNSSLFIEITLAILITGFLFLTCYAIYNLCTKRRISRTRRRSLAREINQERDTDGFLYQEDYGPVLDHPVWYIRTIGLQPSVISSISIVGFKKGDGLVEGTDCSICLTEFEEDESIRLLPKCSHAFHVPCIDTWLRSHTNCPLCRAPILSNSSMVVVPQQELVVDSSNSNSYEETREGGSSNSDGDIRNESLGHDGTIGRRERDERTRAGDRVGFKIENENLGGHGCCNNSVGGDLDLDGIRTLRRSVSSDSVSAGVINALSGNSDANKPVEDKQSSSSSNVNKNRAGSNLVSSVRCPSMERFAVQRESSSCSSSVKRSASCVFLPRYGSRKQSLS